MKRRRDTWAALTALALVFAGCHDLDTVQRPDGSGPREAGADASRPDSRPEAAVPDAPAVDTAARDRSPDTPAMDLASPDQQVPDTLSPDVWTCGNKTVEGTEECDGAVPAGKTCASFGFTSGTLSCSTKTCKLDKSKCTKGPWPFGKTAAWHVKAGQTKALYPGQVYDLAGLTIDKGGKVEVYPGDKWIFVGVNGDVKIHGALVARQQTRGGTISDKLPDATGVKNGAAIYYTVPQNKGGAGGTRPKSSAGRGGQLQGNGGGGGSTYGAGNSGTATRGGDGADATTTCSGGAGALLYGKTGGNGSSACSGGAGGGGGSRGYHGNLVYFIVRGNVTVTGTIDVRGQDGGDGGNGGDETMTQGKGGGGGGGTAPAAAAATRP